jgi:LysM repeat protein
MPVNNVNGPSAAGSSAFEHSNESVATVRSGETTLSDVAHRLGLEKDTLIKANAQIKDPYQKLNVGQELQLPQPVSTPSSPSEAKGSATKVDFKDIQVTKKMDKSSPVF